MATMLAQRPLQANLAFRPAQLGASKAFRGVAISARPKLSKPAQLSQAIVASAAAVEATVPEAVAHLRYSRGSPLKVRRVLDQIRGRSYEEAIMILEYMPYKACEPILKTLLSAGANAKNNLGLKKAKLVVTECYANEGPVMKRAMPRAQGRAYPIHKPTCHICIKVAERE